MTETQRNIKAYQAVLPGLKERVIAVALLLAMSIAMMTSATFAWLTISRNPEVTGVNTTVAANGNLEIALVKPDGSEPSNSTLTDSTGSLLGYELKDGTVGTSNDEDDYVLDDDGNRIPVYQKVTDSNTTWGNLVNLGDPTYGLENLTLRPAQLSEDLLNKPLYAAVYDVDGRIIDTTNDFAYTTWNEPRTVIVDGEQQTIPGGFKVTKLVDGLASSDILGVRAVSSTKVSASGAEVFFNSFDSEGRKANNMAKTIYETQIVGEQKYITSLENMINAYLSYRIEDKDQSLNKEDIEHLLAMVNLFITAYDKEYEAIANMANMVLLIKHGLDAAGQPNFTQYTAEMIRAIDRTDEISGEDGKANGCPDVLDAQGITVTNLVEFINDRELLVKYAGIISKLLGKGGPYWWAGDGQEPIDAENKIQGFRDIVNGVVDINSCLLNDSIPMSSLNSSNIASIALGNVTVTITNGVLKRFEQRTGGEINTSVSVKVYVTKTAKVSTDADTINNYYTLDHNAAKAQSTGKFTGGAQTAKDTYGMAIDLWVRTNAVGSYLTLEGNVLYNTYMVNVMGRDPSGNEVQLYTIQEDTGEEVAGVPITAPRDVYQKTDSEGNIVWYDYQSHTPIAAEDMEGKNPAIKQEEAYDVYGYEGENRIWGENDLLTADSTTQGSGSCYVYYADTPEDQARSLELLKAFHVAFIDDKGNLLAEAYMDTEMHYAESGRITVPLVLDKDTCTEITGADGSVSYGMTALEQNKATRVTALVYLDGTFLSNEDVLAASSIQGQLNIQFGSTTPLNAMSDEKLESQTMSLSATVSPTEFNWDTATDRMISHVAVDIQGAEPSTVSAFFIRAVSSTQGSREELFPLRWDETTEKWVADYEFTTPGTYILRSVRLDGVDYDLKEPQTVTVTGFTVQSLRSSQALQGNHVQVMSPSNVATSELTLKFATEDSEKMPKTVRGIYMNDDTGAAITVNFKYNSTTSEWVGSADFRISGDYTLKNLMLDGEYMELPQNLWQTASVTLGLRVTVWSSSPPTFLSTEAPEYLDFQVRITDNANNQIRGMEGAQLYYVMRGSASEKLRIPLKWENEYYVGTIPTPGVGIWQFANVTTVENNVLSTVTTSPIFEIYSPDPPAYYSQGTAANQHSAQNANTAYFNVQLSNSASAGLTAVVKNTFTGKTYENVAGSVGDLFEVGDLDVNHWTIKLPSENGYQDGNWQLLELRVTGVFDEDEVFHDANNPLVIDVSDKNITTRVTGKVNISFPTDVSANYSGVFMEEHDLPAFAVDITDFEGLSVPNLDEVTLTLTYDSLTSKDYGGYVLDPDAGIPDAQATPAIVFNLLPDAESSTRYVHSDSKKIFYAGSYTTKLSYKVGTAPAEHKANLDDKNKDTAKTLPANFPVFTVSSTVPTVKISNVKTSPTTSINTRFTWTEKSSWGQKYPVITEKDSKKNSFSDYQATLYAKAEADNATSNWGVMSNAHGYFHAPSLTLKTENVPSGWTAKITLPKGTSTEDKIFEIVGSGEKENTIGSTWTVDTWGTVDRHYIQGYVGHGTVEVTLMELTKDGVTYNVPLGDNKLVIVNPSSDNSGK